MAVWWLLFQTQTQMWSSCLGPTKGRGLQLPQEPALARACPSLSDHHCCQLVQNHCWKMLVKRWVCVGLEGEAWRVGGVGGAVSSLMTLRETLCRSLPSDHQEKTCDQHRPQLESCPYSAWNVPH